MSKKQIILLFVCGFATFAAGGSLISLLPVYANRLGADPTLTGFYLSFSILALAVSTVVAGRLSDHFQRRKHLLIAAGVLAVPLCWSMGQIESLGVLTILTASVWFSSGVITSMINILAGLFAEEGQRGRIFGIIGSSITLGVVFGGFASGRIVDRWGFPAMFTLAALLYLVVPIVGLFLQDKVIEPIQNATAVPSVRGAFFNRTFLFLCGSCVLAHIANSGLILGRPLIMDGFHFDATSISTVGAAGELVGLPLPLLIGWLSDRFGWKPLIVVSYLATAVGLLILTAAFDTWHFWVTAALQATLTSSRVVGSAVITDKFPKQSLGSALSLFNATPWIGFVIGFGSTGAAIQAFGVTPTLMFGVLLTLVAIVLLLSERQYQMKGA